MFNAIATFKSELKELAVLKNECKQLVKTSTVTALIERADTKEKAYKELVKYALPVLAANAVTAAVIAPFSPNIARVYFAASTLYTTNYLRSLHREMSRQLAEVKAD